MRPYTYLAIAICLEVAGTLALRSSKGFTRLMPSLFVVVAYATAFYFLSLTLKNMSLGTAYAIWSGVGTALVVIASVVLFREQLTFPGVLGILLIILGVVVLHLSASTAPTP